MSSPASIRYLLETIAARIAALDASAYSQGAGYSDRWTESRVPSTVVESGPAVSHLEFSVIAARSLNVFEDDDFVNDVARLRTTIQVVFSYHVRTGSDSQLADERLAADAAHDIVRTLMDNWPAPPGKTAPDRIVNLVSPWAALVSNDGEWLLVTTEFDVVHDFALFFPSEA